MCNLRQTKGDERARAHTVDIVELCYLMTVQQFGLDVMKKTHTVRGTQWCVIDGISTGQKGTQKQRKQFVNGKCIFV